MLTNTRHSQSVRTRKATDNCWLCFKGIQGQK